MDAIVTCLQNITVAKSFRNTVANVERKFKMYDEVSSYPHLMVLGGSESYFDDLGNKTNALMDVKIVGYTKDFKNPDSAISSLIADVRSCLENSTYNTYISKMREIEKTETDEGMLSAIDEGLGMFVMATKFQYKFTRSSP